MLQEQLTEQEEKYKQELLQLTETLLKEYDANYNSYINYFDILVDDKRRIGFSNPAKNDLELVQEIYVSPITMENITVVEELLEVEDVKFTLEKANNINFQPVNLIDLSDECQQICVKHSIDIEQNQFDFESYITNSLKENQIFKITVYKTKNN